MGIANHERVWTRSLTAALHQEARSRLVYGSLVRKVSGGDVATVISIS